MESQLKSIGGCLNCDLVRHKMRGPCNALFEALLQFFSWEKVILQSELGQINDVFKDDAEMF